MPSPPTCPGTPQPLRTLAHQPMPPGVRGALVHRLSPAPGGPFDISWLTAGSPPLPLGRICLRWHPAYGHGWNVIAHLSLATTEVHLATWPAAPHPWPDLIRPTLYEVTNLCRALTLATAALDLANTLADP